MGIVRSTKERRIYQSVDHPRLDFHTEQIIAGTSANLIDSATDFPTWKEFTIFKIYWFLEAKADSQLSMPRLILWDEKGSAYYNYLFSRFDYPALTNFPPTFLNYDLMGFTQDNISNYMLLDYNVDGIISFMTTFPQGLHTTKFITKLDCTLCGAQQDIAHYVEFTHAV